MTFTIAKDGKWIQPVKRGYKVACCDCGLVHELMFRVRDGRVQFKARRNTQLTRRHRAALADPSRPKE